MRIALNPEQREKALGNLFGLFFEDLNHAADGGLYAELLQNRDFEFDPIDRPDYHPLTAWAPVGQPGITVATVDPPFSNNPHYAVIRGRRRTGLANLGYGDGIPAQKGKTYRLTLWARSERSVAIRARLAGAEAVFALTPEWSKQEGLLSPTQTDDAARLRITLEDDGEFQLAFASLMPVDTWKGRKNGMRADIVRALSDMKPRFLRFPGGCLTHDGQLDPDARDGIYNWKRTLGPVENRPARRNNWGYHQSMGLGFYEYFLLCEDLNCEPLPVVNGGLDPHHLRFAKGELLERYIQDAVDLIDFAKGGPDTEWGRVRAGMGHPEPFRLRYLAIGNEEIYPEFHENMSGFVEAIRAKDPTVELIGSAGPVCHGKPYDMGWAFARRQKLEYVDEHYYQAPEWFLANIDHYEDMPADGPRVFLGEYASWGNRMENALAEAAYMTSLQNAPSVALACYAPLLCHAQYVNWQPDMLWFDNRRLCRTPNYHVQSMFMRHQGDWSVGMTAEGNDFLSSPDARITGALRILADDTSVTLTGLRLKTSDGTIHLPDTALEGRDSLTFGQTDSDFTLECTLRRTAGQKGILIRFGELDDENHFQWTVGGWQNSDSGIEQRIRGRGSCLTQSNLRLDTNRDYHLALRAEGNVIAAEIDGETINRIEVKALRLKPLYLAASVENASGDLILKAVNVRAEPVTAAIVLPGAWSRCRVEALQAAPEAENTLDAPDTVCPKAFEIAPTTKEYAFPPHSVTVLRYSK